MHSIAAQTSQVLSGALVLAAATLLGGGFTCLGRPAATEIFHGVTYGCDRLERSAEGGGVVHWVRVDLKAPGVEPYVTPLDSTAMSQGWQFRLRRVGDVVAGENLAVAVNGTLFERKSQWWLNMSNDLAKAVEPVVADHIVSHTWGDAYLLWFDDQLTPHLRSSKPIRATEFEMAKWGIGGQDFWLKDGLVRPGDKRARTRNARTAVAVDLPRKLLFLAVGTDISPRLLFQKLAELGAKDGMLLDGGNSSSMAIGKGATGIAAGAVYGHWRSVANHFGIRARRRSTPTAY